MLRRMTERQWMMREKSPSARVEHTITVLPRGLGCARDRMREDASAACETALDEMAWEIPLWGPIFICHDDPNFSWRTDEPPDETTPPPPLV